MLNPNSFLGQLSRNQIVIATAWAWAIAQTVKVVLGVVREKRFNFKWFVGSGGMPSSHAALTACLTTSVGLYHGFDSALFAVSLAFAVITMFDAQGVRQQSGKQAEALNKILEDLYAHKGLREERLKELFGHSSNEVFAGGTVGIIVALLMH